MTDFKVPEKGWRIRLILEGVVAEADAEGIEFADDRFLEWNPGQGPSYSVVVGPGPGDVATYLTRTGSVIRLFYMRPLKRPEGWYDTFGDFHEYVNPFRLVNVSRGPAVPRVIPNV